jgi:glycosyltransferase involved in cell wall biosynthesis
MNVKKVIVAVTNDLVTDQRVHKVCLFLEREGFEVLLAGRKQRKSIPLKQRSYHTARMKLLFENGALFYAEYNIRLFLLLVFNRSHLVVANDLDTLPAAFLAAKLKGNPIVYDSHEYYCGTPELAQRPFIRNFWRRIERWIFPRLREVITVNESIAELYNKEYGKKLHVVRNIPPAKGYAQQLSRRELGLPEDKTILILQGAGINIDRGVEELVEAMQEVRDDALLLIVGSGDVIGQLKQRAKELQIGPKIQFIPKVPLEQLMAYTTVADIGLTVDKDTNINYRYSLPNKLFDYIRAGIPVIASRLPEIEKVITKYDIGAFIENHNPAHIATIINETIKDTKRRAAWKANLKRVNQELTWEREEQTLKKIYDQYK